MLLQGNDIPVAKALIAFDAKINAVNVDRKTPLDIVLQHVGRNDSDELEILLLLLGAMRYQEMNANNAGAEGVDGPGVNGTAAHVAAATNHEPDDDVFTTSTELEAPDSQSEHGRRQPSREEWQRRRKEEESHSDRNGTDRSPLASPVRCKLTPSLPTLLEGW